MAKHPNRVQVFSSDGRRLYAVSEREAETLTKHDKDVLAYRTKAGKIHRIQLPTLRANAFRVVSTLTMGDMIASAEARNENRNNRARIKVDRWNEIHDTFAVTIVAGKVSIPNPQAAAARADELLVIRERS